MKLQIRRLSRTSNSSGPAKQRALRENLSKVFKWSKVPLCRRIYGGGVLLGVEQIVIKK